jgi:hypothetical protein
MKHLLWGACAALAVACGGGSKAPATPEPAPKSACAVAADNVASELIATGADDLTEAQREPLLRVLTERCETDRWSDEAVACLTSGKAMGDDFKRCGEMLTDEQEEAAETQLNREVMPGRGEREMKSDESAPNTGAMPPPAGAPPAPPPPDDPCGGGA